MDPITSHPTVCFIDGNSTKPSKINSIIFINQISNKRFFVKDSGFSGLDDQNYPLGQWFPFCTNPGENQGTGLRGYIIPASKPLPHRKRKHVPLFPCSNDSLRKGMERYQNQKGSGQGLTPGSSILGS